MDDQSVNLVGGYSCLCPAHHWLRIINIIYLYLKITLWYVLLLTLLSSPSPSLFLLGQFQNENLSLPQWEGNWYLTRFQWWEEIKSSTVKYLKLHRQPHKDSWLTLRPTLWWRLSTGTEASHLCVLEQDLQHMDEVVPTVDSGWSGINAKLAVQGCSSLLIW